MTFGWPCIEPRWTHGGKEGEVLLCNFQPHLYFTFWNGSPPKSTVRRWTSQSLGTFNILSPTPIQCAHPQTRSWYLRCDVLQKELPCNHSVRKSRLIRDQAVNGESRPKGIVMCRGCLFSDQAARILCASSFRMNSGTSGGRIWDSQAGRFSPGAQSTVFDIFRASTERE